MKLKTLKDMFPLLAYGSEGDRKVVLVDELHQEAIKWIKELEKLKLKSSSISFGNPNNKGTQIIDDGDEIIPWIKHFFNITEEEIK